MYFSRIISVNTVKIPYLTAHSHVMVSCAELERSVPGGTPAVSAGPSVALFAEDFCSGGILATTVVSPTR